MINFKPWYLSKTIWASGISVACALLGFAGVPTVASTRARSRISSCRSSRRCRAWWRYSDG